VRNSEKSYEKHSRGKRKTTTVGLFCKATIFCLGCGCFREAKYNASDLYVLSSKFQHLQSFLERNWLYKKIL